MSYICLDANECRVFIKNGTLKFQARNTDADGNVLDQVTIKMPVELEHLFDKVTNFDQENIEDMQISNRLKKFMKGE